MNPVDPPRPPTAPPSRTSAVTHEQPPPEPYKTPKWLHNSCLVVAVLAPIAMLLPPRRVGFQALILGTGSSLAINTLAYDYTGQSMYERMQKRATSVGETVGAPGSDPAGVLPEKAWRRREEMRLERERREAALPEEERAALRAAREKKESAQRGFVERFWMGKETEDWKAERARKEKEALEEGKGYGDIIVGQLKEVLTGKTDGEGEAKKREEDEQNRKK